MKPTNEYLKMEALVNAHNEAHPIVFKCQAVYRRDGVYECKRCGTWWDANDNDRPECKK